ncbi:hypothetical protein AMATHDRAFT_134859 [Amanita thiersii Skay4041]|uniref:Pescadillo homolog n=1 Tax=Amanita thiersii Skay4041 TaxID=703135 RepID=A0A2A9P0R5_9AGAR|nr:hypothetical protein AMATHDRAFT_134859 [Amanita thiersii Skay4041]
MGRLKQKGKAGAAKAYVTRTAAVRKLQCSLADFRRLCILKGVFPREPRNKRRANKGSSVPTSFYYAKDIAYLAHEPVLKKFREHKAFAKKLSRALGRGEWSSAKSLEEHKPVYKLDHIIKERYPTFIDAVRDIDDALCMVFLFASLPTSDRISPELVENCSHLASQWQLYVMHTRSLRKVFLSIKGVYYQADIMDQPVTWLVPYQFTQHIPLDVDVRVMLTFLELYQTLLGFVFYKLYTDADLVYPPPLDKVKDDGAAGIGAFTLNEMTNTASNLSGFQRTGKMSGQKISGKDVRRTIESIDNSMDENKGDADVSPQEQLIAEADEDFIPQPSATGEPTPALPTLKSLAALPRTAPVNIFSPYTFFLSRETSRPIFEFLIRSFGGRIGWPASSGSGSPFNEDDESITHVIIDRPVVEKMKETEAERNRRLRRKYVQPQWVVDCINAGNILLEEPYSQGKTLPAHLSPFEIYEGAYEPAAADSVMNKQEVEEDDSEEEESEGNEPKTGSEEQRGTEAVTSGADVAGVLEEPGALRIAELAAEVAGVDYGTFERGIAKSEKRRREKGKVEGEEEEEEEMNKMMMSKRQKKLYERIKYSQKKREAEVSL